MKRALYLFLSVLMCLGCSVPVLATSDDAITRVVVSDEAKSVEKDGVIFTREDVPSSIAAMRLLEINHRMQTSLHWRFKTQSRLTGMLRGGVSQQNCRKGHWQKYLLVPLHM